ncbi:MAG: CGNR zinc finger domain-containing protein [Solirubrobacteraceae bacterium]
MTALALVGGDPALDFVNTVTGRLTDRPVEFMGDFDSLMAWSVHAGVLSEAERTLAAGCAGAAAHVHERALALREALFEIFSARADRLQLPLDALALLDSELAHAGRAWRLVGDGRSARWRWPAEDPALVLARVAVAAGELLTDQPGALVRRCAGAEHGCAWLFLDASRGGNRRWCSMASCGNRAKARSHYRRTRSQ